MNIYQLSEQLQELQAIAETQEFSADELRDTFEALEGEVTAKVESTIFVLKDAQADLATIDAEIKRLNALRVPKRNAETRLKDLIRYGLSITGKIDTGKVKASLGKPSVVLSIPDSIGDIPTGFIKTSFSVDKAGIKAALKEGEEVKGCALVDGEPRLTIK